MPEVTVIVDGVETSVEVVEVAGQSEVLVSAEEQAQVSLVVSQDDVKVTVPGPFGTKIFVGPNPPSDTSALWLDTSA